MLHSVTSSNEKMNDGTRRINGCSMQKISIENNNLKSVHPTNLRICWREIERIDWHSLIIRHSIHSTLKLIRNMRSIQYIPILNSVIEAVLEAKNEDDSLKVPRV